MIQYSIKRLNVARRIIAMHALAEETAKADQVLTF